MGEGMTHNRIMHYNDWQFIRDFIEESKWQFAKTYENSYPHAYTLRKWCDNEEYTRMYRLIRRYGYYYNFGGKPYIQLNVNEHYYWTMGWPSFESDVINRKERKIETVGKQGISAPFDIVSDEETRGDEFERMAIAEMIRTHLGCGRVMEIGCGSGLMTQLLDFSRENDLGIDPSWAMIQEFRRAQNLVAWHTDFESVNVKTKYGFIFAACGSASYVRPEYWDRLKDILYEGGTYLLTFYTSGYATPMEKVWSAGGVHFYADDISKLAGETKRTEVGEYTIIEGRM